jgi:cell division FtsZ-interacting protein ZapD
MAFLALKSSRLALLNRNLHLLRSRAGLPDGTYVFKPKLHIWVNFEGLCHEKVGIFYGH